MKTLIRPFKCIQDHTITYNTVQDCTRPNKIEQDHTRTLKFIQEHTRPYKTKQDYTRSYKTLQGKRGHKRPEKLSVSLSVSL